MLQWNREGYGFRMRTITPSSIKNEPLDVLRRGLPVASLTATRSYAPCGCCEAADKREAFKQDPLPPTTPCPLHPSAPQGRVGKGMTTASSDAPKAQTVGSLLIREYENIVDTIVQRTREQERIVREWDIEMERLTERQYRMNYDDVVREFNHKVREFNHKVREFNHKVREYCIEN